MLQRAVSIVLILRKGAFTYVQHAGLNRSPTNRAPQTPQNLGQQSDILWRVGVFL